MTVPFNPGVAGPQYPQGGLPPLPPGYQLAAVPQAPAYPMAPQPMYPAQPQGMPQAPQLPPQFAQAPQGQQFDPNQRLYGPGIPHELQGRTMGEAIRYYGIMREDFVRRQQAPQGQPQAQPQGQPQGAPQGAPQYPQAPTQGQPQ